MYSSKKNVQILVALLKEHGVRDAVISPGSRNMALVVSLENDPFFRCHSVVDERSAAYYAIGVSLAQRAPVLLSCTSAQATRNYLPGLTEAYYRGIPLVAVTADYDQSLIGQGTMQAIDQMAIPRDTAKISVRLPLVKDATEEAYCARLVNEALLELNHHGPGPVHINMPIEEHWDGGVPDLPTVKKIDRYGLADPMPPIEARRILVAVGQHAPFSDGQRLALEAFADRYGAVVYTNHLSNYSGRCAVNGSLFVENIDAKSFTKYQPDLVITIGGQIGEYGFDAMMRRSTVDHWDVTEDGVIRDTYGQLTKVFEMTDEAFLDSTIDLRDTEVDQSYAGLWASAGVERTIPEDLPLSHALVAAELSPLVPAGSVMHFAILSSLRNWNFFDLDPSIECYSNVAAFGIDGCLSTFIGHSVASDQPCFLVIGDLSFFYDMGAIGIRSIKGNARVVLVNNGGGGEFRLYSNAANQFGDNANQHIAAAGHHGSARAWAESVGWGYVGIAGKDELRPGLETLLGDSDQPVLMEVFTTMQDDSDGVRAIRSANSIVSLERKLARMVPPRAKRAAKLALRR